LFGAYNIDGQTHSDQGTLSAGTYQIIVKDYAYVAGNLFGYDPAENSNVSLAIDVSPITAATTTTLAAAPNPSSYGQPVTFMATVSPIASNPSPLSGTVTFMDGSTVLNPGGTLLDASGTATFATAPSALTAGDHSFTAVYSGDSNFSASTSAAAVDQHVNQATPTVAVSDSGGTYNGAAFPATATVAGVVAGVDDTPSASLEGVRPTLTYYAGSTPLAGAPMDADTYTVVASFPGSADYTSTNSLPFPFTIAPDTPTVIVHPVSATYDGQPHGTTGTVSGVNGVSLGAATIRYNTSDGNAPVQAGSYVTTGSFAGDNDYMSATGTAPIVIAPASTTVVSSANPSVFSQSVTFTATVKAVPPGSGMPTGTVTFLDGLTQIGTGMLDASGVAKFSTSVMTVGIHSISAVYEERSDFNSGNSPPVPQIILAVAPRLILYGNFDGVSGRQIAILTDTTAQITTLATGATHYYNIKFCISVHITSFDGKPGSEVLFTDVRAINGIGQRAHATVLTDRTQSVRTYDVGSPNAFQVVDLDGQPGNEVVFTNTLKRQKTVLTDRTKSMITFYF
jgi:hypothetical protein